MPAMSAGDFERTSSLAGRDSETGTLVASIRERKHLHIHGPRGSGKSALLEWAFDNWRWIDGTITPIFCRNGHLLRDIVLHAAAVVLRQFGPLHHTDKFGRIRTFRTYDDLKSATIPVLKQIVFRNLHKHPFFVLIDHCEPVTPRLNSLLTALYDRVPVITASRESWDLSDYSFRGRLAYDRLYLAPKLRVDYLEKHDSIAVMKKLSGPAQLPEYEEEAFCEEVFQITESNLKQAARIIERACMPQYRINGRINLKLIQLDLAIEAVRS